MSSIWPYIAALIPSAGVGFLFYIVIKNMIEGDRRERLAHSQWEAEQEKKKNAGKVAAENREKGVDKKPENPAENPTRNIRENNS